MIKLQKPHQVSKSQVKGAILLWSVCRVFNSTPFTGYWAFA